MKETAEDEYRGDVERIGKGYAHYCSTGGWVRGPKLTSAEKQHIREQVAKHGKSLNGGDAAVNILGGWGLRP